MDDNPANLIEVGADDLRHALSFALGHDGRKRFGHADSILTQIVAEHLVKHLARCGYRVMRHERPVGTNTFKPADDRSRHPHPDPLPIVGPSVT